LQAVAFKYNILVVANRTAGSDELLDALRARAERDSVAYTLLVPAQAPGPQGRETARETMEAAVERLAGAGLEIEGSIGGADPVHAVSDVWDPKRFDEVIVSTLPGAASKWLQVDLPHRVARMTGVQVTHVLAEERKPVAAEPVPEREQRGVLSPLSVLTWGGSGRKQ
jgi:hypothetical protein